MVKNEEEQWLPRPEPQYVIKQPTESAVIWSLGRAPCVGSSGGQIRRLRLVGTSPQIGWCSSPRHVDAVGLLHAGGICSQALQHMECFPFSLDVVHCTLLSAASCRQRTQSLTSWMIHCSFQLIEPLIRYPPCP